MSDDILVRSEEDEIVVGDEPVLDEEVEEVEELPLDPELEEEEEKSDDEEMLAYLYPDLEKY